MNLELAFPARNVIPINPGGRAALCTLWTPPEYALRLLEDGGLDLRPESSPLALVGGLFGGGLKVMLRNLAYNPQIDRLFLYGKDFSGAREHLMNFFAERIERTGRKRHYILADGSRRELELVAIQGRESVYIMDELLLPEKFEHPFTVSDIAFDRPEVLVAALRELAREPLDRGAKRQRRFIELPRPETEIFPSEPHSHTITAESIDEAWEKLLYRLARFGRPVAFRNGKRRHELLNMKAVILQPGIFDRERLARLNLPEEEIRLYQKNFLSAEFNEAEASYTYGHRMRAHFGRDLLALAAGDLSLDQDSRHNFITLWDNGRDLTGGESPCLVALFFRKLEGRLDLTADFRSHNGARAWPRNCFGLFAVMEEVCRLANEGPGRTEPRELVPGVLTVVSRSISIDPDDIDQVRAIIDEYADRSPNLVPDPYGYVQLAVDHGAREIVLQHYSPDNELLDEYRSNDPSALARKLCRREVVSDLSHAMYVGRQLERAWHCLLSGREYVQDKTATIHKTI